MIDDVRQETVALFAVGHRGTSSITGSTTTTPTTITGSACGTRSEWTVGDAGTYRKPVAWINVSGGAAPTGAADAHDSLRKVLGYVHADSVEAACVRVPVTRDAVGPDGTIADPQIREQIAAALTALAQHVARRDSEDSGG